MKRKKKRLKYKKERIILSEVLPYELPITFSNRHFYDFLLECKVEYRDGNIFWEKDDDALDEIIRLLFGVESNAFIIKTETEQVLGKNIRINYFERQDRQGRKLPDFTSIPFGYKIRHKENEYRELTICHPRNQLYLVDFYHLFKESILYYCGISPFSIRRPTRIAKSIFHKDRTHYENLTDEPISVEEWDKEYENLRSFFVYKDYSNIHRFYESYKYHRCEKKYNSLLKVDISKCFDSIYTHSIQWALLNKETVKENLKEANKTFSGQFDVAMQLLNYKETNGIIIGPEFSRIFAELILQSIDRDVCVALQKQPYGLYHGKDYEIYRYVDDYFIFYNHVEEKDSILKLLQLRLREYKLYLNHNKSVIYEKPIITEISIAKQKIARLLDEKLAYKLEKNESNKEGDDESLFRKKGSIYINSNTLITHFKTIIKECGVRYEDVLNYTLYIIEKKCVRIIKDYRSILKEENSEKKAIRAILEILKFTFFIYSVTPRASITIKLCRILALFIAFLKSREISSDSKHLVFKFICDEICFILKKNKNQEHIQIETLYLLIILSELGKDYWLDVNTLLAYFDIKKEKGDFKANLSLNYFSLTILLFYIKKKKRYDELRNFISGFIKKRFEQRKTLLLKDAELTLLLFDTLTCPYIENSIKKDILNIYDVTDPVLQDAVIKKQRYWFTMWENFDLLKELDAKQSREVY